MKNIFKFFLSSLAALMILFSSAQADSIRIRLGWNDSWFDYEKIRRHYGRYVNH